MTDTKLIIGKRIRNLRLAHKLTQAQFAELIDISVNFLSEIENGKKGMSQDTLYKLCSKFSVSADYILFGSETNSDSISSSDIIEYANNLDSNELEVLSNYLLSLIDLRNNINS
ncbi:MAG: helix-turn-helix transcriptional regulator [Lachnospiraceae bacterium]|nr:helix-turn-helix transcriptional regulator [Lachnospiraceae bacterium]